MATLEHDRALQQDRALQRAIARLNARAWGIAFGLLCGGGLFLATIILVLRGGETVGPHLGLLRYYFPGYSVTFLGGIIGFVYAFVLGYALGRGVGAIYNRMVEPA